MLKVDEVKKVIYEYRGLDSGFVPSRCREITIDDLRKYTGYRFFDLSEWCVVRDGVVAGRGSFRSKADAEYFRQGVGEIRRVSDVMEMI